MRELARALHDSILMAQHAFRLHCFNTLAAIITGISHRVIERLPRVVWDAIDDATRDTLARLSDLCSPLHNFSRYRAYVNRFLEEKRSSSAGAVAAVPLLPVVLRDITFIFDGNPDTLQENGVTVVNTQKMQLLGDQLRMLARFKSASAYTLRARPAILKPLLKSGPLTEKDLRDQLSHITTQLRVGGSGSGGVRPSLSGSGSLKEEEPVDVEQLLLRPVVSWRCEDVAAWLRTENLNEWAGVLQEARVDGAGLAQLDGEKMIALGLIKLGVRKRLQAAVASLLEIRTTGRAASPKLTISSSVDSLSAFKHCEMSVSPQQWNPHQVCAWLYSIGEGQSVESFRAIRGDELLELTDARLIELGVARLGIRKRLLREIAALVPAAVTFVAPNATDDESASSSGSPHSARSYESPRGGAEVCRRQQYRSEPFARHSLACHLLRFVLLVALIRRRLTHEHTHQQRQAPVVWGRQHARVRGGSHSLPRQQLPQRASPRTCQRWCVHTRAVA